MNSKDLAKNIVKILIVTIVFFALNPVIHFVFDSVIVTGEALAGPPDIMLLLAMILVQSTLIVIAFNLIKDHLPGKGYHKGILFMAFFLFSVQIPSVFGLIAFEVGADWLLFTPAKIANYVTLMSDIIIFVLVGVLLGKLFSSKTATAFKKSKNFCISVVLSAILFPILFLLSMKIIDFILSGGIGFLPANGSLWFNLMFYGIFAMTGACLPILHNIIIQNKKRDRTKNILLTTIIFLFIWMPVQNFMFIFGWNFFEGFVFSLVSIIPIIIVIVVSDLLMYRKK
jgi:hypothetical protein